MPDVFTDEVGTYDLTITTTADWTVSSGGMPNGDNYVTGDGSINPTYNLNGDDFNIMDGTAWTIECWIYIANNATTRCIACVAEPGAGPVNYWELDVLSTESVTFGPVNTASSFFLQVSSAAVTSATWHHVVAIKETGNVCKLYIDNTLVSTDNTSSGSARTPTGTCRLYVGSYGDGGADWLSGERLAKLAIYNRELSAAEINEHYLAMTA